ncbi:MAG: hypothetical protein IKY52_09520 [Clostridia bacterium]|nr:hypothetical protein [Clostridia bacterium]
MKRLWFLLILAFCLTGCGKEADPEILTGIYTPVWEADYTAVWEREDGYYAVDYRDTSLDYEVLTGEEEAEVWFRILELDGEGNILEETPLDMGAFSAPSAVGNRGIYMLAEETLYHIGWDGNVIASADWDIIRPDRPSDFAKRILVETENGLAAGWDKQCTLLSEDLTVAAQWELPKAFDALAVEGDTVWIVTTVRDEGETVWKLEKWEDGAAVESWYLPGEIASSQNMINGSRMIACEDGFLYGWNNSAGVYRWEYGREDAAVETVLQFASSGINGSNVRSIQKLPGREQYTVRTAAYNRYNNFETPEEEMMLVEKAPDKDLSQMTVLTLACYEAGAVVEDAVLRFNRTHTDAYIKLVTYSRYNTDEDAMAGYDRLDLDLHTGLLQADILIDKTFSPIDLYPLMTGEIRPEDIAPCVKNSYEKDGQLHTLGSFITFSSPAGKTEALGGMTHWDLETFLDFAEELEDGEYLMEYLSRDNADYVLFNNRVNSFFLRDGQACFEDPLYLRYLAFLAGLPAEGQEYFDHGINTMEQVIAGETDQLIVQAGDENLYYNGKIKLYNNEYGGGSSFRNLDTMLNICGALADTDITLIGYPSTEASGVLVLYSGKSFSIPSTCRDPALAWEFIEDAILQEISALDGQTAQFPDQYPFTSLTEPYMQYLASMEGYQMSIYRQTGQTNFGKGLTETADTVVFDLTDTLFPQIRHLYETAGYTASVPTDIRKIVNEEQSRFLAGAISAEECADIVQSRVGIYLAEHE